MKSLMNASGVFALVLGFQAVHVTPVFADFPAGLPIEVVQSVPIETTLAVPGIRMTQDVWLEMINGAQSTIDLEEFYVYTQTGQALEPVLEALQAAAGRGVKIRLIIDSQFYKTYPDEPNALSQVAGIEVKSIDFSASDGVQHSKYFVVDGNQAFLGSANFDWLAITHIHEVGVHFTDPVISAGLESIFNLDWGNGVGVGSTDSDADQSSRIPVSSDLQSMLPGFELFASPDGNVPAGIPNSLPAILNLINGAQSSIQVQVYEYDTSIYKSSQRWTTIDDALRAAAARGVQVQLMVDQAALKAGKKDLMALEQLTGFEVKIVRIPQWSGGYIPYARLVHSKYMIVDGNQSWLGSENWSGSYFTGCRNVGLTFSDPTTIGKLSQIFNQVWTSAYVSSN